MWRQTQALKRAHSHWLSWQNSDVLLKLQECCQFTQMSWKIPFIFNGGVSFAKQSPSPPLPFPVPFLFLKKYLKKILHKYRGNIAATFLKQPKKWLWGCPDTWNMEENSVNRFNPLPSVFNKINNKEKQVYICYSSFQSKFQRIAESHWSSSRILHIFTFNFIFAQVLKSFRIAIFISPNVMYFKYRLMKAIN